MSKDRASLSIYSNSIIVSFMNHTIYNTLKIKLYLNFVNFSKDPNPKRNSHWSPYNLLISFSFSFLISKLTAGAFNLNLKEFVGQQITPLSSLYFYLYFYIFVTLHLLNDFSQPSLPTITTKSPRSMPPFFYLSNRFQSNSIDQTHAYRAIHIQCTLKANLIPRIL